MKDRAELYQEIKKFFKQEVEPLLKKYEKERKEDMLPVLLQHTCIITTLLGFLGSFIFPYLILLSIISGIILISYCAFSKNKKIKKYKKTLDKFKDMPYNLFCQRFYCDPN